MGIRHYIGLICLLGCLVACDWGNNMLIKNHKLTAVSKQKRSIIIGNGEEPESLDPQKAIGLPEGQILRDLFEGLISVGSNGKLVPGVAITWDNSQDSKVWIFHLRPDAKWSNGKPVTAHDFVYAWRRLVDPSTASIYASYLSDMQVVNADEIVQGKLPPEALGVKALDPQTFEVTLTRSLPYLPDMVSHQVLYPVYRKAIERHGIKWTQPKNIVSNGAYELKSWLINNRIIATKNPYYWDKEHVKIEQVEYLPIPKTVTDAITFMSGNSDITYGALPVEMYAQLKKSYPQELKSPPQLCTYYYVFNKNREVFKDVRVRKALNLLVDRKKITDRILKQGQIPSYTLTPYYTQNFHYYKPDWANWNMQKRIDQARKLLSQAGYSARHPLKFEILYNTQETNKTVALAVSSEWKSKVNFIQPSLLNKEWKSYVDSLRLGDFDIARRGWCADYNEPSSFLNLYKSNSTNNHIHYRNSRFDRLMNKSLDNDLSDIQRENIYLQAEKVLMGDAILVVLYTAVAPRLVRSYIKGYSTKDPMNFIHTKELEFKYDD